MKLRDILRKKKNIVALIVLLIALAVYVGGQFVMSTIYSSLPSDLTATNTLEQNALLPGASIENSTYAGEFSAVNLKVTEVTPTSVRVGWDFTWDFQGKRDSATRSFDTPPYALKINVCLEQTNYCFTPNYPRMAVFVSLDSGRSYTWTVETTMNGVAKKLKGPSFTAGGTVPNEIIAPYNSTSTNGVESQNTTTTYQDSAQTPEVQPVRNKNVGDALELKRNERSSAPAETVDKGNVMLRKETVNNTCTSGNPLGYKIENVKLAAATFSSRPTNYQQSGVYIKWEKIPCDLGTTTASLLASVNPIDPSKIGYRICLGENTTGQCTTLEDSTALTTFFFTELTNSDGTAKNVYATVTAYNKDVGYIMDLNAVVTNFTPEQLTNLLPMVIQNGTRTANANTFQTLGLTSATIIPPSNPVSPILRTAAPSTSGGTGTPTATSINQGVPSTMSSTTNPYDYKYNAGSITEDQKRTEALTKGLNQTNTEFAQQVLPESVKNAQSITEIIIIWVNFFLGFYMIIAVLILIYLGIRLLISGGSEEKRKAIWKFLQGLIFGTMLILGSYAIIRLILAIIPV